MLKRELCGVLGALVITATGCGVEPEPGERWPTLNYDGSSPKYIYRGVLPALEQVRVVASLEAHTVRVTGLLPPAWSAALPHYAYSRKVGDRVEVSVVYPIATGVETWQHDPGTYDDIIVLPHVPSDSHAEWGGFPYMEYNHKRSMAFHGPITHAGATWKLQRGRVSHGCKRMQGEHAVEMAHLLGADMTRPHGPWDKHTVKRAGIVKIIKDVDVYNGQLVDVSYPPAAGVQRPPARYSLRFPAWSANELPRVVCEHRPGRALGPTHCDDQPQGSVDIATGQPWGQGPTTRPFGDMRLNWAEDFVVPLRDRGILSGYPDGTFRPHRPLSRAEFAALINAALGLSDTARWPTAPGRTAGHAFVDLPPGHWARLAIQQAYRAGFIAGLPDNRFDPDGALTRVQALVSLASGLSLPAAGAVQLPALFEDHAQIPSWAVGAVQAAVNAGLVVNYPGKRRLAPGFEATRADVAALVYQALVQQKVLAPTGSAYLVSVP